jgi:hypothetical protein
MSTNSYYSKIIANTYNDNVITVKTLKSKFNATTSPILQNDDRYVPEQKQRAYSKIHMKQTEQVIKVIIYLIKKPAKKVFHLKQTESKEFNHSTKKIINTEPKFEEKKQSIRLFPLRHLKDSVQRLIFSRDQDSLEVPERFSSIKVNVNKPPSEETKKLNDKKSFLRSDLSIDNTQRCRAFSRTMSSSIFKSDNQPPSTPSYTVSYSNTIKYKHRPDKDNVTDLIRYTDCPRFRDDVR